MRCLSRCLTLSMVAAIVFAMGALAVPAAAQVATFYTYPVYPSPADTGNYSAIRSVAVISALGKNLTLRRNRFLGPRTAKVDIADWRFDEFATRAVKSYLGDRFTYEDVTYDGDAIAALPNGGLANSAPQLRAVLQKLPPNTVDAYIVLRPNTDFYDQTEQQGLALVQPQGDGVPAVIANFEIAIIDAKSLITVGRASSRIQLRAGGYNVPHFAHLVGSRRWQLETIRASTTLSGLSCNP